MQRTTFKKDHFGELCIHLPLPVLMCTIRYACEISEQSPYLVSRGFS